MKLVQTELIYHRNGRSAIKCRWKVYHGRLVQWLLDMPKVEIIEVVYIGSCNVWRELATYQRVSSNLEEYLCDIEASLIARMQSYIA